jgi:unsaturated rhamnogalacturonyl hydrolase
MRVVHCCLFFLIVLVEATRGQAAWPDAASVAEVMQRANDYWISNNAAGNSGWARGAYYTGNQRAFRVLGERNYWTWANTWAGANQWKIGPEGAGSADAYCCGQTYLDLYRLNPQAQYLADIKARTDTLVASPAVDGWWWIDAFYMQAPVLARLGKLTGDTNYYQKLWLMFDDMKTRRGLFDASASLWFRDGGFFYPAATTANGQKVFWSRGNGWVFAGLARVLQQMPADAPHYQDYVAMFQTMAPALKAVQGGDGLWRSSLYDAAEYPNPETSGTGFFTYGMAWGIRSGLLPAADYTNTVILAWQGLTNLALNASGRVGYVQNVGAQPAAASASNTTDFGVGAFLLAGSEIYLLAPDAPAIRAWAGPDQTVLDTDENGFEPVTLDASETEIYRGTAVSYTWWEGANQIASGITAPANLSLGEHVVTVKVLGSDGLTCSDSMTVAVAEPPVIPPPVPKLRFDFEDSGSTTTDALAGVTLDLVNGSGAAADLHGPLGSGVGGAGRALDFTSAASQGGNGPLASTVGNSTLDFGTVNAFTVTLWIKPAASLLQSGYPRFFSLGTNGTTDRGVPGSLQLLSNGNLQPSTTAVQGFVNAVQTSPSAFGAFDMPAGEWRFLALTYDGATLNFYGGSETNAVSLASTTGFAAGAVPVGSSWTLMLGNRLGRDRAFRGWIDDVRFHLEAAPLDYLETIRQQAMPPAQIAANLGISEMSLRVNTRSGLTYVLESAPDLGVSGVWTPVSTNLGTGGIITNTVPLTPAAPNCFFRYRIQ